MKPTGPQKNRLAPRILAHAVGTMFACGGMTAALAQEAQSLQRVEVTGSAIKRTQVEGPAPLEIIKKQEIERTGATTINELLKSIPTVDIFDQGELTSNSPSGSGTANVRMRNLAESNVLVLLNGRRLPVNGLYDGSGAGAAVDVNMIPLSAIERVEILKDGASAIYGADAVAGVINFITKKDYQGIEVNAGYGSTSKHDGVEQKVGFTAGFGDLNSDHYNVLLAVDYFRRTPILRKNREISKSVDFRRLGGSDGRSVFAPEGNLLDADFEFTGATVLPCPPDKLNDVCRYDFNSSLLTAYNGADRLSTMLLGSFKVSERITAYSEIMYAKTNDHFDAHPVPDIFTTSTGEAYTGRFMQGGPRTTDRDSDMAHLAFSLEGNTDLFDWKAGYNFGQSTVLNKDSNYYNRTLWDEAIAAGTFDATSFSNPDSVVSALKVSPRREGNSIVKNLTGQISGEAFQLPAGRLGYAVGLSFLQERLTDYPDVLTQQGLVVGSIQQAAVAAKRNAKSVFAELSIPILKNLEGQVAVRHDKYPNESKTSPKVALKLQALPQLAFRASYAESFRPPSLKQLYGSIEQGAITITDDDECRALGRPVGCTVPAFRVEGSNTELKAEKGKTYNLGVIFEPTSWLNGSLDYFMIKKKDDINTPTTLQALQAGRTGFDPNSGILLVFRNLSNISDVETSGIDLDLRASFKTDSIGKLSVRNSTTYYFNAKQRNAPGEPLLDYIDTYGSGSGPQPRWRNLLNITSEIGNWTTSLLLRSTASFYDIDQSPVPDGTRRVESHHEVDLTGSYKGFKGFEISYGVKNLLDRDPPFSNTNASNNDYSQQGFPELYSSRGRFFYAGISYKFR